MQHFTLLSWDWSREKREFLCRGYLQAEDVGNKNSPTGGRWEKRGMKLQHRCYIFNLKKIKNLKWSKPWWHLTAQRACALEKVLGEPFKGPVKHFKESIGKKWNEKLVESLLFLFSSNEHLCFHKEQWDHWRGSYLLQPCMLVCSGLTNCTLTSELVWRRCDMGLILTLFAIYFTTSRCH